MLLSKKLKDMDMYGGSIGFTFKGEKSHNTVYGGICSLISYFFLALFYCLKIVDFVGKVDPQVGLVERVQITTE